MPACTPRPAPPAIDMQMKRATLADRRYLSLIGFVYSALTDRFQFRTEFVCVYAIRYANERARFREIRFLKLNPRIDFVRACVVELCAGFYWNDSDWIFGALGTY